MGRIEKLSGFNLRFKVFCENPLSVKRFLFDRLVTAHAEKLDLFISQGNVRCNGRTVRPADVCLCGDDVDVFLDEHFEDEVNTEWHLLWENAELLAVYKPHLLPVSRTTRNLYNTLVSVIRRQTPYSDARLLHRLDTETAGIILLAKDEYADRKWKPKLHELIQRKAYHAWVVGEPEWQVNDFVCDLSEKQGSEIRSQVYVVDQQSSAIYPKPRQSRTVFTLRYTEGGVSLVECELHTGRKHQIRAQLSHLGHPILGDKIYSEGGRYYLKRISEGLNDDDMAQLGGLFHRLVASSLQLCIDGEILELRLPESLFKLSFPDFHLRQS